MSVASRTPSRVATMTSLSMTIIEGSVGVVVVIAHVVSPGRRTGRHGQMRHEVIRRRPVPVLLARRRPHDVARADSDDRLAAGLSSPFALGHVEVLAAVVAVPGGAGAGMEVDGGDVQCRVLVGLDD